MSCFTRFWTKSGSEYLIDHDERIWRRGENRDSPLLRTSNGLFRDISEIVVGKHVVLLCPPLVAGFGTRVIVTSKVVRIEHEHTSVSKDARRL